MAVNLQTENNLGATNQYIKDANGNESKLSIGTNEVVGIGTTSPNVGLHLKGVNQVSAIVLENTNSGNTSSWLINGGRSGSQQLSIEENGSFNQVYLVCKNGQIVFNDNAANIDFIVEGDTDTNLLVADASADKVGIGTSTPGTKLDVAGEGQFSSHLYYQTLGAKAYHTATAGTSNNSWLTVPLNSESWDTASIHNNSTNNSRMTVGRTGKWRLIGSVNFQGNATGVRRVRFIRNGTDVIAAAVQITVGDSTDTLMVLPAEVSLASGDYVEMQALQNSGGSLDLIPLGDYGISLSCTYQGD